MVSPKIPSEKKSIFKDCCHFCRPLQIDSFRASGGASRCCYGEDDFLIYAGDSEHGSFSSRAHFEGSYPHAEPGRVPLLSHWLHDLLPHLMCCDWTSDSDSCLLRFMASRPTRDCSVYHSPGLCEFLGFFFANKDFHCCYCYLCLSFLIYFPENPVTVILPSFLATGYGDPHFRSMDDTEFTYNGKGEFWLLRSILTTAEGTNPLSEWEHIRIQVRLEQPNPKLSAGM